MIDVGARTSRVRAPVMRVIASEHVEKEPVRSSTWERTPMPERVIVVTGSSGGIGSAIVDRFPSLGDIVVGLDLVDGVDVSRPDDCAAAAARIIAEHGAHRRALQQRRHRGHG